MINRWVYILGFILMACIGGILLFHPNRYESVQERNEIVSIKNPIGFFCGADCSNCDHSVDRCLEILQANLQDLCGGHTGKDCYTVEIEYAKTCKYLCAKPMLPLTTAAKMVDLVVADG